MKLFLFSLLILSVLTIGMIGIDEAYAGGAAYENRANGYWLQIYMTLVIIIGVIATSVILAYKFKKRKVYP